jgi:hypothetical protein
LIEFSYYWAFAWWIASTGLSEDTRYMPLVKMPFPGEYSVLFWVRLDAGMPCLALLWG